MWITLVICNLVLGIYSFDDSLSSTLKEKYKYNIEFWKEQLQFLVKCINFYKNIISRCLLTEWTMGSCRRDFRLNGNDMCG